MDQSRVPWSPILTGGDKNEAETYIDAIAAALEPTSMADSGVEEDGNLSTGATGIALFFGYLHLARPDRGYDEHAAIWLEEAAVSPPSPVVHSLFIGATGIAWLIHHFATRLFDFGEPGWSDDLDEHCLALVTQADASANWDLIKGLAGTGIFFAEGCPASASRAGLHALASYYADIAETTPHGTTWRYRPEAFFFDSNRESHTDGVYNLTIAHGISAILAILANARAFGVLDTSELMDSTLDWLLHHELPEPHLNALPMGYDPRQPAPTEQVIRLAWCRGDIGIAGLFAAIGDCIGESKWTEAALRFARRAARRIGDDAMVDDAGICHGASGVALLFARLFQRTGDPSLRDASRHWFRKVLAQRRPELTTSGGVWTLQREHGTHGPLVENADSSFLLGAAGVGLTLLAATTDVEPEWDRLLLASLAAESATGN